MTSPRQRYLHIYMNDQLAAGVLWRELARRSERANARTELGAALARVATAIAEDVQTFQQIMEQLAIRPSRIKPKLAVVAERLGRLKLNGQLTSYSPLSRFEELDVLIMGIQGKKTLWTNLRDLADSNRSLAEVDFGHLLARADQQISELEPFWAEARRRALK